jgi:hypothetical protein
MTDNISIAQFTPIDTPYNVTLDSSNTTWKYALTSPNGTVTRNAGPMSGVDSEVILLYALATALQSIPKGVTIHVAAPSHDLKTMGERLTKPAPIPELPFLPFTADRRTAWGYVLPLLSAYNLVWKNVSSVLSQ